jgi:hypothetical protein
MATVEHGGGSSNSMQNSSGFRHNSLPAIVMSYRIGFSWRISVVGDANSREIEVLCQKEK